MVIGANHVGDGATLLADTPICPYATMIVDGHRYVATQSMMFVG